MYSMTIKFAYICKCIQIEHNDILLIIIIVTTKFNYIFINTIMVLFITQGSSVAQWSALRT